MLISRISLLISLIAIVVAIWAQYELFVGYQDISAKTRAFYGITHLIYYKYANIGIVGLLLSVISIFKKEKLKMIFLTLGMAILSILLLILEVWKLFS